VAAAILTHQPARIGDLRPDLPASFGRVVHQCLEKDPAARPESARVLVHELEALRQGLVTRRRASAPSIAVLPFRDMSRERDQSHLCEGIAEEIIGALARLEGVRVASRTASFRFAVSTLDVRGIGLELGVDALLAGSVRKEGDRLRVAAELVAVQDGLCLWSEHYDREVRDVFAIEEQIAARIAEALQGALSPGERSRLGRASTRDIEAYDFYLRGRQFFNRYSRQGMLLALEMFGRAIGHDPDFALAHAGVADCHAYLWLYMDRSHAHRRLAEEASRRALEIDPAVAQAHVSRGLALSLSGEHERATTEFETAARLNPELFEAYYFHARDRFVRGDLAEALRLYEKAFALRPEDYQSPLLMAQIYDDLGRPGEARAARRRGIAVVEENLRYRPDDVRALYMAANGLAALGEKERGLEWADRALALDPNDSMLLYNVACVRALAGDNEAALDALERAAMTGVVQREWMENDSNLAPLRSHPRYRAVLERLS
jgi:TolB-like protein/Flp pilus assembly protein TadD